MRGPALARIGGGRGVSPPLPPLCSAHAELHSMPGSHDPAAPPIAHFTPLCRMLNGRTQDTQHVPRRVRSLVQVRVYDEEPDISKEDPSVEPPQLPGSQGGAPGPEPQGLPGAQDHAPEFGCLPGSHHGAGPPACPGRRPPGRTARHGKRRRPTGGHPGASFKHGAPASPPSRQQVRSYPQAPSGGSGGRIPGPAACWEGGQACPPSRQCAPPYQACATACWEGGQVFPPGLLPGGGLYSHQGYGGADLSPAPADAGHGYSPRPGPPCWAAHQPGPPVWPGPPGGVGPHAFPPPPALGREEALSRVDGMLSRPPCSPGSPSSSGMELCDSEASEHGNTPCWQQATWSPAWADQPPAEPHPGPPQAPGFLANPAPAWATQPPGGQGPPAWASALPEGPPWDRGFCPTVVSDWSPPCPFASPASPGLSPLRAAQDPVVPPYGHQYQAVQSSPAQATSPPGGFWADQAPSVLPPAEQYTYGPYTPA